MSAAAPPRQRRTRRWAMAAVALWLTADAGGALAQQKIASLAGQPKRGREAASRTAHPTPDNAAPVMQAAPPPIPVVETPINEQTVRVDIGGGGVSRSLSLPRGKSAVIELPVDARDVVVSDPKVAEVILSTPRRVYLLGQAPGQTDAVFFDGSGRQLLRLAVRVDQDTSAIAQTLNRLLPGAQIKIDAVNDNIVLSGLVPDAASADKAVRVAQGFTSKPDNVLNMLTIAGRDQVMLKVKIIEVNRSVIKQLGFNLSAVTGAVGMPQYSFGINPTFGVNGNLLGGITGGYKLDTKVQPEHTIYDPVTQRTFTVVDRSNLISTPQASIGKSGLNSA